MEKGGGVQMFGLFQPAELKATLGALNDIRRTFQQVGGTDPVAFGEAWRLAIDGARHLAISQKSNTLASIRDQRWKPRDLALLLLSKVSFRLASSGQFHVYRGAPMPTGVALRSIFEQAGSAMAASGFITQAENEKDQQSLRKAMAEAG
jgi:hypothetical protein